ncbi:hypothetical protein TYRP_014296 [Tyrophagus putrescentiae]|nr:hypothetical protein TYRP_014296 [Tyrophagus putrescentiae]
MQQAVAAPSQQPKQSKAEPTDFPLNTRNSAPTAICAGAAQARHINSSTLPLRRVFTRGVVGSTSKQGSGRSSRRSGHNNNNMNTSKEDVTAAQASKRRATLRRWITISHQALSAGVNPGKSHQPPITRQAIPPFDGSPAKYRRFEELFESLVEESPSYTDAAKFLYFCELIGKLTDQYAPNLSPTLANLQVLKGRLRERFEDAGRVREHVRATFEKLPVVRQSTQTNLLHQLIVAWEEGVLALQKTGTSDEQINNTYVSLMTHHLPSSVLKECNYEKSWTALELLDALKRFHKRQLELSEASSDSSFAPQREPKPRTHIHVAQPGPPKSRPADLCVFCTGAHKSIYCTIADPDQCRAIVIQKQLCVRCLRAGHHFLDCQSRYVCSCGGQHSKVLCARARQNQSQQNPRGAPQQPHPQPRITSGNSGRAPLSILPPNNNSKSSNLQSSFYLSPSSNHNNILQSAHSPSAVQDNNNTTVPKQIHEPEQTQPQCSTFMTAAIPKPSDSESDEVPALKYSRPELLTSLYQTVCVSINGQWVRVLLDSGGGRSAILASCANRLNLPTYAPHHLSIGGMGGDHEISSTRLVKAEMKSLASDRHLEAVLPVIPSFGNLRPAAVPDELWYKLREKGIVLSDEPSNRHQPVEIIIGLEYYGRIWLNLERYVTDDIVVRESIFGWTAFGVTLTTEASTAPIRLMCSSFESKPKECTTAAELSPLEKQFLEEFVRSKVTQQNGQYFVQLPWLEPTNLGSNLKQATDRFHRLVKIMHKLLSEIINNEQQYPELSTVASLIKDRFYVDDLMLSFQQSTPEQIDAIQAATVAIFSRGSMNVRKWRTNVKELDEKWSPNAAAILKVLGHKWSVILDSISLFADLPPQIELSKLTKRLFSSLLARIYDPMGLITPYIGLDWDEPVPDEIRAEVLSAVKDAHLVNSVTQPRNVIGDGSSPAKLVVFCDASKNALGAVAYAVVNNKPLLLFSKSRLVRLSAAKKDKEETIAELELDALVMSSETVNHLSNLVSIRLAPDKASQ